MTLTTQNFSEMHMNNGAQYQQHPGELGNGLKTNGDALKNKV